MATASSKTYSYGEDLENEEIPDDTVIILPAQENESRPLTKIPKSKFSDLKFLTRATLGAHVENMGERAFQFCGSLEQVDIAEQGNLEAIPDKAFRGCKSLKTMKLPQRLRSIGKHAFDGCVRLENIQIPDSVQVIDAKAFLNCERFGAGLRLPKDLQRIGMYAFDGCGISDKSTRTHRPVRNSMFAATSSDTEVPKLEIPPGVQDIGEGAFRGCCLLRIVRLPDNLPRLGAAIFAGCTALEKVENLSENITEIPERAFRGCSKLYSIILPRNLKQINRQAFQGCKTLLTISFPPSVEGIDNEAFRGCNRMTVLNLPANLKRIGRGAFAECSKLRPTGIPDSVKYVGYNAFFDCRIEQEIAMPSRVSYQGKRQISIDEPFLYILESQETPRDITSLCVAALVRNIPDNHFRGCKRLKYVDLGTGVRRIGTGAFADCTNLDTMTIPKSVTHIEAGAFSNTQLQRATFKGFPGVYEGQACFAALSPGVQLYTLDDDTPNEYLRGPEIQVSRQNDQQLPLIRFDCLFKEEGDGDTSGRLRVIGTKSDLNLEDLKSSDGTLIAESPIATSDYVGLSLVFQPEHNTRYFLWYSVDGINSHKLTIKHAVVLDIREEDQSSQIQLNTFTTVGVEETYRVLMGRKIGTHDARACLSASKVLLEIMEDSHPKDDFVSYLLRKGADVDMPGDDGCTAIHIAAKNSHHKHLGNMLKQSDAEIDKRDAQGRTALHHAAFRGNTKCVAILLLRGAKIELTELTDGETAIHLAARGGHSACLELLADFACVHEKKRVIDEKKRVIDEKKLIDETDLRGHTALSYAAPSEENEYDFDPSCWNILLRKDACMTSVSQHKHVVSYMVSNSHTVKSPELLSPFLKCRNALQEAKTKILKNVTEYNPELNYGQKMRLYADAYEGLPAKTDDDDDHYDKSLKSLTKFTEQNMKDLVQEIDNPDPFRELLENSAVPMDLKFHILRSHSLRDHDHVKKLFEPVLAKLRKDSMKKGTVFNLLLAFYCYAAWITAYLGTTVRHARNPKCLTIWGCLVMLLLSLYFLFNEWCDLRIRKGRYFGDLWNWIDLLAILSVDATAILLLLGGSIHEANCPKECDENRHVRVVMVTAAASLTLSLVGFLKTTLPKFSIFVGGVSRIIYDLFPFAIVTGMIIVAFSHMYYIASFGGGLNETEVEGPIGTFGDAFRMVFGEFVGSEKPQHVLDYFFSIIMVIILLNVLIAIVSNSWDAAEADGLLFFCKSRWELLLYPPVLSRCPCTKWMFDDDAKESNPGKFWFLTEPFWFLLGIPSCGLTWRRKWRESFCEFMDPEEGTTRTTEPSATSTNADNDVARLKSMMEKEIRRESDPNRSTQSAGASGPNETNQSWRRHAELRGESLEDLQSMATSLDADTLSDLPETTGPVAEPGRLVRSDYQSMHDLLSSLRPGEAKGKDLPPRSLTY